MSTDTTNRGRCPACFWSVRVNAAGVLVPHTRPSTLMRVRCPGSGQRPEVTP